MVIVKYKNRIYKLKKKSGHGVKKEKKDFKPKMNMEKVLIYSM